ncbi:MAG TPA: NAD(P)-dependent oxidoreductase [Candidatus Nanoarchaeia archaeon]|nr:NAD(P)-dependent oxidoreductase [Candidatus Nanoarchaeia archaeon]
MAKIAGFELEQWEQGYLRERLGRHRFFLTRDHSLLKHLKQARDAEILTIFINTPITKEALDKLPRLRLIATMSTGFDHIDLAECRRRKIVVSNVPFYGENTVAEHTFALILALSRRILPAVENTRKGYFDLKGTRGFDLKGKTLGIVGGGHIGMHVARMAAGFEMKVLVYDIRKDRKLARKMGFRYSSLNSLLRRSDVISLHLPYNTHTHHIINKKNISLIRKGALLINTARGGLIETDALIKALASKRIMGAGLDVLEGEAEIKEERQLLSAVFQKSIDYKTQLEIQLLLNQESVLVTPHSAFNSKEALHRILDTTVANIRGFLQNRVRNRVR